MIYCDALMSNWRDLLMLNMLRAPVGNMRIFNRIRIRNLHVVQSADPHYTRSLYGQLPLRTRSDVTDNTGSLLPKVRRST